MEGEDCLSPTIFHSGVFGTYNGERWSHPLGLCARQAVMSAFGSSPDMDGWLAPIVSGAVDPKQPSGRHTTEPS
jgi:hypothetical protein